MNQTLLEQPSLASTLRDGLGLIFRLVRGHPLAFLLALSGAALYASAIAAAAFVVGRVADDLIIPALDQGVPYRGRIVGAVLAIAGVAVWKACGIVIRRTAAGWLQYRSQADLRQRLIDHQLRLELAWFGRRATGDLLSVSENDARDATFILAPLPYATGATLLLIASVALMFAVDWPLGVVSVVAVAAVASTDLNGSWRTFGSYREIQQRRGAVSGIAHESFDGALTVKALGREAFETQRLERASHGLRDSLVRIARTWTAYRAVVDSFVPLTIIALLVVGAIRIDSGALTPGELVTAAYLFSLLSIPMRMIGYVLWDLAESLAAWKRVHEVLIADDFVSHGSLKASEATEGAAVDAGAVHFSYAEEPVLANLDLDVMAGRTIAIVGPTASGKSTLAMLLARLWDPTSGRIAIDGRDLRDFARSELPGEIAFVGQETFLFNDTVTGNITLGRSFTMGEVERAAALVAADRFVTRLPHGYDTLLGERGTTLSGGQRQRIALARAVVRRPRLMILDDATSAVDPSIEVEILEGLRRADLPSTVIVIAYRPSSIVLADEVIYMEAGTVVAHGTHEELLQSTPGYARLLTAYEEDAAHRAEGKREDRHG